jgi:hypothetical protein
VLAFQLPQPIETHRRTMSVGGNDLLTLLGTTPPTPEQVGQVLTQFGGNLLGILTQLCGQLPEGGEIYVQNLYTIPEIPGADQIVPLFNGTMTQVVTNVQRLDACLGKTLAIADVYGAFLGQKNLLLIERYLKKGILTTRCIRPTRPRAHNFPAGDSGLSKSGGVERVL